VPFFKKKVTYLQAYFCKDTNWWLQLLCAGHRCFFHWTCRGSNKL